MGNDASVDHEQGAAGLLWIGAYDIAKGTLILLLGVSVLHLLHRDVEAFALHWVEVLHADPDNRYIHALLARSGLIDDRQLELVGAGSFLYAALHYAEGIGLMLRKRWAEYLTVAVTGAFLPVEFYELVRHVSLGKVAVTILNIACVAYVGRQLLRGLRAHKQLAAPMTRPVAAPGE